MYKLFCDKSSHTKIFPNPNSPNNLSGSLWFIEACNNSSSRNVNDDHDLNAGSYVVIAVTVSGIVLASVVSVLAVIAVKRRQKRNHTAGGGIQVK